MRRTLIALVALFFLVVAMAATAHAAKRVALVIGIDAYQNVNNLQKAVNDARAVSGTLERLGFTVLTAENVNRRAFNQKLLEFSARLDRGDEALFFFAGHGVTIEGRDYLLPADVPLARPGQEEFIKSESVATDRVLDIIRARGTRVSILIIDACRDNPFPAEGTRSLGAARGLAGMAAPEGTFILYSAGVGQTALDRLGDNDPHPNSVFTRKLVPIMQEPGLPLVQAARRLRREVQDLARTVPHDQRPAYYDEVTGQFFFTAGTGPADEQAPRPAPAPGGFGLDSVAQAWLATKDTTSTAILQAFIARFPDTVYADFAKARLAELERDAEARQRADDEGRREAERQAALREKEAAAARGRQQSEDQTRLAADLARRANQHYNNNEYGDALKLARQAADLGNASGMFRLAWMQAEGLGTAKNEREAIGWYEKAAELGHVVAHYNLGVMYSEGRGVPKDEREAVRRWLIAAEKEHVSAMRNLGNMYRDGRGVPQDYAEAAKWFFKAADKGHTGAQYNLARQHMHGWGVAKDQQTAARYMLQSLKGGYDFAQREMTNNASAWDIEFRRELQRLMQREGVYSGPIDGEFGPATVRAIEALAKK